MKMKTYKVSFADETFCFNQAIFKLIPKDEVADLPEDENTPEKRTNKLWEIFQKGEKGKKIDDKQFRLINL